MADQVMGLVNNKTLKLRLVFESDTDSGRHEQLRLLKPTRENLLKQLAYMLANKQASQSEGEWLLVKVELEGAA